MTKELLFEIGTEEIPARFMPSALKQLEEEAKKLFAENRISYHSLRAMGTPRRLVLHGVGFEEMTRAETKESKGPSLAVAFDSDGKATRAAEGFARGQGIPAEQLTTRDGYIWAEVHQEGKSVVEVLPEALVMLIQKLNFPKAMRWGSQEIRFARPVHWLIGLFGDQKIDFSFAEIESGLMTRGHRVLGSQDISVSNPEDYFAKLRKNGVILDQEERKQLIVDQVNQLAEQEGGSVDWDEALLSEVVYLVETPTALCGVFEDHYLKLPADAVITPMKEHQRYFPILQKEDKSLLPRFITVRNGDSRSIDLVRQGNERVLRARLADARFFYEEDQKVPLADKVDKLGTIVFQDGLGTMKDKVIRLEKLTSWLAGEDQDRDHALRTAYLAKADLVTGMVTEFTELQGVMGEVYARLSGEDEAVAKGIFEHYLPRFAGDDLPETKPGRWVSLADKMDNLVGTFSRGLIPTGSQDPYALRRQALGIVLMLITGKIHLSIREFAEAGMEGYGFTDDSKQAEMIDEIEKFFRIRLRSFFIDLEGFPTALADAVISGSIDDLADLYLRAKAVQEAWEAGTIAPVLQSMIRIGNILKENNQIGQVKESFLEEQAEKDLWRAWQVIRQEMESSIAVRDYDRALKSLSTLAEPIESFFNQVMVMAENEEIKINRLTLITDIRLMGAKLADFNKLNLV